MSCEALDLFDSSPPHVEKIRVNAIACQRKDFEAANGAPWQQAGKVIAL
jgi:hypothetical protein